MVLEDNGESDNITEQLQKRNKRRKCQLILDHITRFIYVLVIIYYLPPGG